MLSTFSCVVSHLYVIFEEMSVKVFWPHFFFNQIFHFSDLRCMSCLYILEINFWSVALFASIFSHSKGCLFILILVFFIVQKFLNLIWSLCWFLFLLPLLWEVGHKGLLPESVLPMLSSKSFIVYGLLFLSLIHFKFTFVYGVRKCSKFFFFNT